jgi:hypothetical protein
MVGVENNALGMRLKELYNVGLISGSRNFGKDTVYKIIKVHECHILYLSEIIYLYVHNKLKGKEFRSKLKDFKESELYNRLKTREDVMSNIDSIVSWFFGTNIEPSDKKTESTEPKPVEPEQIKRTVKIAPQPTGKDVDKSSHDEKSRGRTKAKDHNNKPVSSWTIENFKDFFGDLYEQIFKLPRLPVGEKVTKMLISLLRVREDKELIKKYMEIYLEENAKFPGNDLYNFCLNSTQSSIDEYVTTGKVTTNKNTPIALPEDDEFAILEKKLRAERDERRRKRESELIDE